MDGDYDNEEDSCYGWGNYGCDQGEMENASWVEIIKHDERNADRQKAKDNYPGDEEVIDQVANMVKNMDDPRDAVFQLQADYPHMGKAQRASIVAKAMKKAGLTTENTKDPESKGDCEYCLGSGMITGGKTCPRCDGDGEEPGFGGTKAYESNDENEALIAKVLAKALGDKRRGSEDPYSLFAELESENHQTADMIALMAKMIYGIKLQERAYKDVGVADVVKDRRGKEFKFDKSTKQFKSIDGEVAGVNTKLGQDLMRLRRNAMKRTSPSYPKNKMMASVEMDEAEYNGKDVKLNKPMRQSGGGKKYKVYVKNPKTGRVKKISFGDAGLKTKSGNKKRAKSFAARHNCEKKNDKQKAGYWACRLPRYGLVKGGKWW
jgi:hypothetical protein